ncbi:MAG: hypothetical protein HOG04_00355, partial [Nitrospinaceae bacterium]|nr:hypothetical protein [Nitrospinaceae bacterium]
MYHFSQAWAGRFGPEGEVRIMVDETGEAPAAEEEKPEELDEDVRALRDKLGADVLSVRLHRGQLAVEIAPASLVAAASFLRDSRGFKMLS